MKAQTKSFLESKNLYPKEKREQTPLDRLIQISADYQRQEEEEYQRVLKKYDDTGIYEDSFLEILRESLSYLQYGIKVRYRNYKRSYGKNMCGPCPK